MWMHLFVIVKCLILCCAADDRKELHLGGIFPINGKGGWQGGQACMPAAKMALEDINSNKDLLTGYKLTLHSNDSEVSVFNLLTQLSAILAYIIDCLLDNCDVIFAFFGIGVPMFKENSHTTQHQKIYFSIQNYFLTPRMSKFSPQ